MRKKAKQSEESDENIEESISTQQWIIEARERREFQKEGKNKKK